MSSAQRSIHYARALLRAFQKEPSRIGRTAGSAVLETAPVKSMKGTNWASSLRDSDLHSANSFQKVRISGYPVFPVISRFEDLMWEV